jgi:hypothetical protein
MPYNQLIPFLIEFLVLLRWYFLKEIGRPALLIYPNYTISSFIKGNWQFLACSFNQDNRVAA